MADNSAIEWTDATWNPITGCSVVSPGCTNCYAMRLAGTRLQNHPSRAGLTRPTSAGPVWNGEVRLNEQWLDQPLRWRRPRRIFVCAHGDLFHPAVPEEWIDRVFRVMSIASHHTFQVLTKRPDRMRAYLATPGREALIRTTGIAPWPLPNVWCGVSVEDQRRADERMPTLRHIPANVRFFSAEPLLGPVQLDLTGIDWVIVGGESGPNARPIQRQWVRDLRDQCVSASVPFFFKQWGAFHPVPYEDGSDGAWMQRVGTKAAGAEIDGREWREMPVNRDD